MLGFDQLHQPHLRDANKLEPLGSVVHECQPVPGTVVAVEAALLAVLAFGIAFQDGRQQSIPAFADDADVQRV